MKKITIVIPALNEEKGIGPVIREIPVIKLEQIGYKTEILGVAHSKEEAEERIYAKSLREGIELAKRCGKSLENQVEQLTNSP